MAVEQKPEYRTKLPNDVMKPVKFEQEPFYLSEADFLKLKDTRSFWSSYAEKFFFLFLGLLVPALMAIHHYYETKELQMFPSVSILIATALFFSLWLIFLIISFFCKTERTKLIKVIDTHFTVNRPIPKIRNTD